LSGAIRRLPYSDCGHVEECMTISVCDVEINRGLVSGWHLFHISSFLLFFIIVQFMKLFMNMVKWRFIKY